MTRGFALLLTIVALLLMPAGMIAQPALAQGGPQQMAMADCAGHQSRENSLPSHKIVAAHCMLCAALPEDVCCGLGAMMTVAAHPARPHDKRLQGTQPEVSVPPPKVA